MCRAYNDIEWLVVMLSKLKKIFDYYKNPKYRIMKGVRIDNRALLFLAACPITPRNLQEEYKIHGYCDEDFHRKHYISFKNQKFTYSKSNMLCVIWTFRNLLKWARLLKTNAGDYQKVLEYKNKDWVNIDG